MKIQKEQNLVGVDSQSVQVIFNNDLYVSNNQQHSNQDHVSKYGGTKSNDSYNEDDISGNSHNSDNLSHLEKDHLTLNGRAIHAEVTSCSIGK